MTCVRSCPKACQMPNRADFSTSFTLADGVDQHFGGLGGGHYTAAAKSGEDSRWYSFDDSRVSSISDPQSVVVRAVHVLSAQLICSQLTLSLRSTPTDSGGLRPFLPAAGPDAPHRW